VLWKPRGSLAGFQRLKKLRFEFFSLVVYYLCRASDCHMKFINIISRKNKSKKINRTILLLVVCVFSLFVGSVLAETHGQGQKITPDVALNILLKGNQRFVKGAVIHPHQSVRDRVKTAREGQKPVAAILSCSDSRVPPEIIFDAGIGDIFVIRIAGNVAAKEAIGSIEYAVDHLGVKLILVLGHTKCGAVTAAANNDKVAGDLAAIIDEIKPAVAKTKAGDKNLTGDKLILESTKSNVQRSIQKIMNSSSLSQSRLQTGDITVIGALYDIETGSVTILKSIANL